jgi:hypothetical protein
MKRIGFITVVAVALLVLATGAWIADGIRAVRGAGRTRRAAHDGRDPDSQRGPAPRRPDAPDLAAVV